MAGTAISLSLITSSLSLPSVGMAAPVVQLPPDSTPAERCAGEEGQDPSSVERNPPPVITNEEIVREAWEVVNESFLDSVNRGWSPEKWQVTNPLIGVELYFPAFLVL